MNSYYIYKKDEIKYLENEYKVSLPHKLSLNDYIDFKRNIFINIQGKYNITVTNKNSVEYENIFTNNHISYKYSYTRYDSYINYSNFCNDFYKLEKNNHYKSKVFFTNSGMSAITSLLLAINTVLDDFSFLLPDEDIYFETYDFYNKYIKDKNNINKNILYIDTIAKKFDIKRYINLINNNDNIFAVVIDTTCFLPNELNKLISSVINKNLLCVLVRSHTKLDMMGSEISSLGSLVYLIPRKTDNEKFQIIKRIISESYYLLGKFGALCLPDKFPEFIFDKKFKKINNQRIKQIENNNYKLYTFLKDNIKKGKIILPKHQKFILYVLNEKLDNECQSNIIENSIKLFVNKNEKLFYACSFGFDYIALDSYYDINEKNYVMRISMNDDENNVDIFNEIKEFINDNF
ncbi:MAG: hypothetical protein IJO32_01100 [Bacilli bacterium]|nr:hypothetical protein [Bacilli bacterium]